MIFPESIGFIFYKKIYIYIYIEEVTEKLREFYKFINNIYHLNIKTLKSINGT